MKARRSAAALVAVIVVLCLTPSQLISQGTGQLAGVVRDDGGRAIAG